MDLAIERLQCVDTCLEAEGKQHGVKEDGVGSFNLNELGKCCSMLP